MQIARLAADRAIALAYLHSRRREHLESDAAAVTAPTVLDHRYLPRAALMQPLLCVETRRAVESGHANGAAAVPSRRCCSSSAALAALHFDLAWPELGALRDAHLE